MDHRVTSPHTARDNIGATVSLLYTGQTSRGTAVKWRGGGTQPAPVAARLQHVFQARRAPHPAENVVARAGETHTSRAPADNADTGREQTGAPPPPPPAPTDGAQHTRQHKLTTVLQVRQNSLSVGGGFSRD